jgi:acyl carrier protein
MRFSEEEITATITKLIFGLTYKTISSEKEVLVDSGILSSITIAELAVELEKSFFVSISFMEINKENFNTLSSIKNLIKSKVSIQQQK